MEVEKRVWLSKRGDIAITKEGYSYQKKRYMQRFPNYKSNQDKRGKRYAITTRISREM